jgi:hypothetical protein
VRYALQPGLNSLKQVDMTRSSPFSNLPFRSPARVQATSSDILPPFRPPSLLFFPDPSPLDSLDSLAERAEDLARLMQDNAVLMGRDPAEGIGGTRQDGEGGGENVEEEDGAEESALAKGGGKKGERGDCGEEDGGSPAKRARGGGVKDHFRVHKPGRKSSGGTRR